MTSNPPPGEPFAFVLRDLWPRRHESAFARMVVRAEIRKLKRARRARK